MKWKSKYQQPMMSVKRTSKAPFDPSALPMHTIIVLDLDAPTPLVAERQSPLLLHLRCNLHTPKTSTGEIIVPFNIPEHSHPVFHRVVALLLQQNGPIDTSDIRSEITNGLNSFPLRKFIKKYRLKYVQQELKFI